MGLILKPTGNRNEFERVRMYEESFPLSKSKEKISYSGYKRCHSTSHAGDVVVELV